MAYQSRPSLYYPTCKSGHSLIRSTVLYIVAQTHGLFVLQNQCSYTDYTTKGIIRLLLKLLYSIRNAWQKLFCTPIHFVKHSLSSAGWSLTLLIEINLFKACQFHGLFPINSLIVFVVVYLTYPA